MTIEALLFDFDGLILDTETPAHRVWSDVYREHGHELQVQRWAMGLGTIGGYDPHTDLEELVGQKLDRQALHQRTRHAYDRYCEEAALRPGIQALLDAARDQGLKLAVASSSTDGWVEKWLERHCIRAYFSCIRTRTSVPRVKPAPDLFLSAAACLGVAPAHCIVLEDSLNGMRAAAAAGMRCVAVPLPLVANIELPPHSLRLETLADLAPAELLRQLDAIAPPAGVNPAV